MSAYNQPSPKQRRLRFKVLDGDLLTGQKEIVFPHYVTRRIELDIQKELPTLKCIDSSIDSSASPWFFFCEEEDWEKVKNHEKCFQVFDVRFKLERENRPPARRKVKECGYEIYLVTKLVNKKKLQHLIPDEFELETEMNEKKDGGGLFIKAKQEGKKAEDLNCVCLRELEARIDGIVCDKFRLPGDLENPKKFWKKKCFKQLQVCWGGWAFFSQISHSYYNKCIIYH